MIRSDLFNEKRDVFEKLMDEIVPNIRLLIAIFNEGK
jgi:hypothetical protein